MSTHMRPMSFIDRRSAAQLQPADADGGLAAVAALLMIPLFAWWEPPLARSAAAMARTTALSRVGMPTVQFAARMGEVA